MRKRTVCNKGMGWIREYPSIKDYTVDYKKSFQLVGKNKESDRIDLRHYCSSVDHQDVTQSCTAHAASGLIEYWQNKNKKKSIHPSRLFIYKVSRSLAGIEGDNGSYLRSTAQALVLFGAPPEEYYPFIPEKIDDEPSSFVYALAQNYQSTVYYRLDSLFVSGENLLTQIKIQLSNEVPCMFGFSVYSGIEYVGSSGLIPFPRDTEAFCGGHAVLAVGYDNEKNAILIKNSWGRDWGCEGYGWLPYDYVLHGLTADWWCITNNEWVDLDKFALINFSNKGEVIV
jgi:C1A family cysteine protease